jgi:endonuclease G
MQVDSGTEKDIIKRAEEAWKRWDARRSVRRGRQDALDKGDHLGADTPERLTMRANRLIDDVRRACKDGPAPSNPELRRLVERPGPVTTDELNEELLDEVVLGARNFLSIEFFERGLRAARSVGCVLIKRNGAYRARGTGFLVAPGVMLTNEHVLTSATLAAGCALQMDYEQNFFGASKQPQTFLLRPDLLFLNHVDLDFALVGVEGTSETGASLADYGWLPLLKAQGKISISDKDYVNIVQHPQGREKEVVVRDNLVLDMRTGTETAAEALGGFLHYETDTEKGSSGSPVCNDGWEVVALHHSGVPKTDGQGRWLTTDDKLWNKAKHTSDDIAWVANEAVRVSSIVDAAEAAAAGVKPHERPLLDSVLAAQQPPAFETLESHDEEEEPVNPPDKKLPIPPNAQRHAAGSGEVTIEIPLRITVSLGQPGDRGVVPAVPAMPIVPVARRDSDSLLVEAFDPEDFADREGFDRKFLKTEVPLPKVRGRPRFGGALKVNRPARPTDKTELCYHHYSVVMSAERRLAYFSACNLDFAAPETASRTEGRDSWLNDPRIKNAEQLGARFYTNNDYDRGHLTRRDDTAWGDTKEAAIAANDDTFFFTNAAPQHYLLNQATEFTGADLQLWGDLENHISRQGADQRARLTIFNGPIFGTDDKKLRGALVPLSFFKIVIWHDNDAAEPGAVGFVLEQADLVANLPEEAIEPGPFSIRQKRISEIEAMTDLNLGPVSGWDRLAAVDPEESLDDGIDITAVGDIRL